MTTMAKTTFDQNCQDLAFSSCLFSLLPFNLAQVIPLVTGIAIALGLDYDIFLAPRQPTLAAPLLRMFCDVFVESEG